MPESIQQFWNFDDADLDANRLGKLTDKQRKYLEGEYTGQKNVFLGVGGVTSALIVAAFCCLPVLIIGGRVILPMALSGDLSDLQDMIPFAASGVGLAAVAAVIVPVILVMGIYLVRAGKKADISVKHIEGKVEYSWGTKRVRNPGNKARPYDDVRVLHLGISSKKFEVHEDLKAIIKDGQDWAVYYTSYPFKFLSGEKIK